MKKIRLYVLLVCLLFAGIINTSAMFVPDNVICESRNGRQLIIKTFHLSAENNPDSLIEDSFTQEGYMYSFLSLDKEEKLYENKKTHSETVTVETQSKDLSVILNEFPPALDYNDGEYSGSLIFDHSSMQTEASGYTTRSYTITDIKIISGLDRNDPSYVPKTTVKDGYTLTLTSIEWSVQETGFIGETYMPSQYTATASYSGIAYQKVATGYITTGTYSGEIVSRGISYIIYTITYHGEAIPPEPTSEPTTEPTIELTTEPLTELTTEPLTEPIPEPKSNPAIGYVIFTLLALLLIAGGVTAFIFFRYNTKIYALGSDGVEYELIERQWITSGKPYIDLRKVKKYPAEQAVVEIKNWTANRLFGRLVKIQLRDGMRTHFIEQNGRESYWFTVSTVITKEENAQPTPGTP